MRRGVGVVTLYVISLSRRGAPVCASHGESEGAFRLASKGAPGKEASGVNRDETFSRDYLLRKQRWFLQQPKAIHNLIKISLSQAHRFFDGRSGAPPLPMLRFSSVFTGGTHTCVRPVGKGDVLR